MTRGKQQIRKLVGEYPRYGFILGISLLFFLYKGVSYALIGSYLPLLVFLGVLALWFFGLSASALAARRVARLWAFVLILWASVRLLLAGVNQFLKPIPEGHVDAQLGLTGTLLSLAVLFCGGYLWKFRNRVFNQS